MSEWVSVSEGAVKFRDPPFSNAPSTMSLQEEFDLAVEVANKLPKASNEDMLELYGWFKQANVGDVNTGASVPREPARFHRVRIATPRSTTDPCPVASPLRRPPRHVRLEGEGQVGRVGEVQGHVQGRRDEEVLRGGQASVRVSRARRRQEHARR